MSKHTPGALRRFTMLIEQHTPSDSKHPCQECVLDAGMIICMDKSYCEFKKTGKTWKKAASQSANDVEGELIKALKDLLRLADCLEYDGRCCADEQDEYKNARAAIAKAKGEA